MRIDCAERYGWIARSHKQLSSTQLSEMTQAQRDGLAFIELRLRIAPGDGLAEKEGQRC